MTSLPLGCDELLWCRAQNDFTPVCSLSSDSICLPVASTPLRV